MSKLEPPKKGQRWQSSSQRTGECRVMSDPIEGWVMVRYKGAMPFCVAVRDWHILFDRVEQETEGAR